jgi:hypothetical protein
MRISPISRRFTSIPIFGLFSLFVVSFFSLAFLIFSHPEAWKDLPSREVGELSGLQVILVLSLSAGVAAAGSGMLLWRLLILLPWQWLQTRSWGFTALFGGFVGLIEIICTSWLMWIIYILFLLLIVPASHDITSQLLPLLPLGTLGLGIFTLVIVSVGSKGVVFLVGIGASMSFALIARRIFS